MCTHTAVFPHPTKKCTNPPGARSTRANRNYCGSSSIWPLWKWAMWWEIHSILTVPWNWPQICTKSCQGGSGDESGVPTQNKQYWKSELDLRDIINGSLHGHSFHSTKITMNYYSIINWNVFFVKIWEIMMV